MKTYYEDAKAGIVIYHADCRDVLPTLERVDHCITDPPYARDVYSRMRSPDSDGGNRGFKIKYGDSLTAMKAGDIGAVEEMIDPCAIEFARVVNRWALVFSDVETCHVWRCAMTEAGLRYVRTGAWVKPDAMPQMTGDRPGVGFEPATICHALGPMRWNGGGHAALWTYNTVKGDERPDHPCPKPLGLMRELVERFTDGPKDGQLGDLILDPFGGSGTTARAAKDLGRRCILIEREEKYCEIAAKRMSQEVLAL